MTMPHRRNVLIGATAGVLCFWALLHKLRHQRLPKESMEVRQQKLAEAAERFGSQFPKVPLLSASEVHQLIQEQPQQYVIVDVRNKEEQKVSMLPGSRVLTAAEYEQQRDALAGTTIICYCTVGYRSSKYANSLLEEGQQAVNLRGGIIGWTHAGLPLVDGKKRHKPSSRVHTYGQKWALQGDGYHPVYYRSSKLAILRDVLSSLKKALIPRRRRRQGS